MNEYKYQASDAKDGKIIVARADTVEEVVLGFDEMKSKLMTKEVKEVVNDVPFQTNGDKCPQCGVGHLKRKQGTSKEGKDYDFVGCDNYPNCKYVVK